MGLAAVEHAWASWLDRQNVDPEDPNPVINAVGVFFGQCLVEALPGFAWVLTADEEGTDLAVYRLPDAGDVLIYPAGIVAERYEARDAWFLTSGRTRSSRRSPSSAPRDRGSTGPRVGGGRPGWQAVRMRRLPAALAIVVGRRSNDVRRLRGPRGAAPSGADAPSGEWQTFAAEVAGGAPGPTPNTVAVAVSLPDGVPGCAQPPRVELLEENADAVLANVVFSSARAQIYGGCPTMAPAEAVLTATEEIGARTVTLNQVAWTRDGGGFRRAQRKAATRRTTTALHSGRWPRSTGWMCPATPRGRSSTATSSGSS